MNLNIQNATPETVEVQGQTVTRAFAEGVMLTGLIAGAGKNLAAQEVVVKQYLDAGLSAASFPDVVRAVQVSQARANAERERQLAESRAHAERFKSYQGVDPLITARRRAARDERARKYREMGQAIRAANGRSSWSSSEF
ncbi:hypothetical protein [Pseudomonas capsici]|uniref:DUF6971 domain-containing protein n=1 Tax=Pseudomonas capsici TaxID=2810614 RepID=A0ABT3BT87_9PSED|nr:hypothetical protein [Pseudomonas capsici]MCV4266676.1 hypothetical protein [Pseudomonas capsici]MCV4277733.1 hypothetical protein [Pseudomonas capsici]MCV4331284.1 hypothetical protein [Pseudomonas capsici]MCV4376018.1 hypothetical protein [Pseudomonas capsici]